MKIRITGQPNGNMKLYNLLYSFNCISHKDFQNYTLSFHTKKEAITALSKAYQNLKSDKEDWNASMGSYIRGNVLCYDASKAKIIN